ncbi:MAG: hypothetical protein M3373_13010 [Gemmatimonadota bacterium]|nr:hypothetical protein [Gemmatimonadota bacterium]
MTVQEYYARALWLPVAVPAVAALLVLVGVLSGGRVAPAEGTALSEVVLGWAALIVFVGAWSLVPYAVFALVVAIWIHRHRPRARNIRRVAWLAPLLIGIPFGVVLWTPLLGSGADFPGTMAAAAVYAVCAVVVGYAYLLPIELALLVAQRFGWVENMETEPSASSPATA